MLILISISGSACFAGNKAITKDLGTDEYHFIVKNNQRIALFISAKAATSDADNYSITHGTINTCLIKNIFLKIRNVQANNVLSVIEKNSLKIRSDIKECLVKYKNIHLSEFMFFVDKLSVIDETKPIDKPPEPMPIKEYIDKYGIGEKT